MKLIFGGRINLSDIDTKHDIFDSSVKTFLKDSTFVCANLYSILQFKHFDILEDANIGHLSLANSFIGSQNNNIIHSIKAHLKYKKIMSTGAGINKSEAKGIFINHYAINENTMFKIGFLSVSFVLKKAEALPHEKGILYYDMNYIEELINHISIASKKVDLLVVNVEWMQGNCEQNRKVAKQLILAGAKIVHGNCENMYPVEIYDNSIIIWSCGQFIGPEDQRGLLVMADIDIQEISYPIKHYTDYLWYFTGYKKHKPVVTYTLKQIQYINNSIKFVK